MSRSADGNLVGLLSARERFDRTLKCDEAMDAKVAALTPEQIAPPSASTSTPPP